MAKKKATNDSVVPYGDMPLRVRLAWDQLHILCKTVWGEARDQGHEGMLAVACVIMNRSLASVSYGAELEDVCLKRGEFACWAPNNPGLQGMVNMRPGDTPEMVLAQLCVLTASRIAGTEADPTHGATHYHASEVSPDWAEDKEPCVVIGDRAFFNDIR